MVDQAPATRNPLNIASTAVRLGQRAAYRSARRVFLVHRSHDLHAE
jgi:hypothetical protein